MCIIVLCCINILLFSLVIQRRSTYYWYQKHKQRALVDNIPSLMIQNISWTWEFFTSIDSSLTMEYLLCNGKVAQFRSLKSKNHHSKKLLKAQKAMIKKYNKKRCYDADIVNHSKVNYCEQKKKKKTLATI